MAPQNTPLEAAGNEAKVGGVLVEVSLGSDITCTTPLFPALPLPSTPTLTHKRPPTPTKEDLNTALFVRGKE